tara:strand:- start:4390 stop:5385 length:996 start_codon:yes stop_codon:yes gene_type:complete
MKKSSQQQGGKEINDAFYFKGDPLISNYRYFYKHNGFYHAIDLDKEFSFNCYGNVDVFDIEQGGFESLEKWAKFKMTNAGDKKIFVGELIKSENLVGRYYPRMWRGSYFNLNADDLGVSRDVVSKSKLAVELLFERLIELFNYVEPQKSNLDVFGFKIRELILLSCMEVESSFKAILRAHSYLKEADRLSTKDYIKLLDPLKLDHYQVQLIHYPEIGIVNPFSSWDKKKESKSLPWYYAYNMTKHNREEHLRYAKLSHAIESVCAAVILLCSQFGPRVIPQEFYLTMNLPNPDWFYIPLIKTKKKLNERGNPIGIEQDVANIEWSQMMYKF